MTVAQPIGGRIIARNSLLNLIALSIPLFVAVIVLPTTIERLGEARFGVLALAWVVTGYFTFLEFGIGRAAVRHVSVALGRGDDGQIPGTVWTAVTAQAVIGTVAGACLAGLTPFLVNHVLSVPAEVRGEATATFLILSLAVPPMIVSSSMRGLLESAQRFDLVNLVRVPTSISTHLIPFAGVLVGWSLPVIVSGMVAAQTAALVGYGILAARVFPAIRRPHFDRAKVGTLMSFGWWVTAPALIAPLTASLDRFVLGSVISVTAVAFYAAPADMLNRLWIVPASVISTMFPAVSRLQGQGDSESIRFLVGRSMKYLLLGLGPLLVVIAANAQDLISLWLDPGFADRAAPVLQLLSVGALCGSLAAIAWSVLQALGRADLVAKIVIVQLIPYTALLWFLVSALGLMGAALASTLQVGVVSTIYLLVLARVVGLSTPMLVIERVPQTILTIAVYAGVVVLIGILFDDLTARAFPLAAASLILVYWSWSHLLDPTERTQLRSVLRHPGARR